MRRNIECKSARRAEIFQPRANALVNGATTNIIAPKGQNNPHFAPSGLEQSDHWLPNNPIPKHLTGEPTSSTKTILCVLRVSACPLFDRGDTLDFHAEARTTRRNSPSHTTTRKCHIDSVI
jgi:hypothetical protein